MKEVGLKSQTILGYGELKPHDFVSIPYIHGSGVPRSTFIIIIYLLSSPKRPANLHSMHNEVETDSKNSKRK